MRINGACAGDVSCVPYKRVFKRGHYNESLLYIHYSAGADELVILHGNRFSP